MKVTTRLERQNPLEVLNEAWTISRTIVGRYSVIYNSATNILQCQLQIMVNLIVESYKDSTVNSILDDIARKYKIDTSKELLSEDIHVQEVKFKYRTYGECIRILYKNVGYLQEVLGSYFHKFNVSCCTVMWTAYVSMQKSTLHFLQVASQKRYIHTCCK